MAELGKAYVQIIPSAQGISGSISSILDSEAGSAGVSAGRSIAGGIGSALKGATGILAGSVTALTASLTASASSVATYGDNIDKMSQKMGISAQGYQEWEAVMQHSGTSMETMKASMKTLANAVENGNGAFERLGISVESLGEMSNEQIFESTIAALQNVDNETERTYLAGQLLGRGATELGALLNTSAEDTQAMRDRVRELGGVMSDDAVKAAAQFKDNLQDLKTAVTGIGRNMVSNLLPSFNQILAGFTSLVAGEEGAKEKLKSGFSDLFSQVDTMARNALSALGSMLSDAVKGLADLLPGIIQTVTELLINLSTAIIQALPQLITTVLPALLDGVVQLVIAIGQAIVQSIPLLLDAAMQLVQGLLDSINLEGVQLKGFDVVENMVQGIVSRLPDLITQGTSMVQNLMEGLITAIPTIMQSATQVIGGFTSFLQENAPLLMQSGITILQNLMNGLISAIPEILNAVITIITSFVQYVTENLPTILECALELMETLVEGLVQGIALILEAMPEIISAIFDTLLEVDWIQLGKDIIAGIVKGIQAMAETLIKAIQDLAKRAFDSVKEFFQIGSPSKLMANKIGHWIPPGIAVGIEDNTQPLESEMQNLSSIATSSFDTNVDVSGVANNGSKTDAILELLARYLPDCAKDVVIDGNSLLDGIDRGLGMEGALA